MFLYNITLVVERGLEKKKSSDCSCSIVKFAAMTTFKSIHLKPQGTRAVKTWWDKWMYCCRACVYFRARERTCGVDGYPVDASVLCLKLLQEHSHAVAERLQGELTALSPGRQTDWDHRQPVLVHHRHLCSRGDKSGTNVTGEENVRFEFKGPVCKMFTIIPVSWCPAGSYIFLTPIMMSG